MPVLNLTLYRVQYNSRNTRAVWVGHDPAFARVPLVGIRGLLHLVLRGHNGDAGDSLRGASQDAARRCSRQNRSGSQGHDCQDDIKREPEKGKTQHEDEGRDAAEGQRHNERHRPQREDQEHQNRDRLCWLSGSSLYIQNGIIVKHVIDQASRRRRRGLGHPGLQ